MIEFTDLARAAVKLARCWQSGEHGAEFTDCLYALCKEIDCLSDAEWKAIGKYWEEIPHAN